MTQSNKPHIIVIVGPTASGKSDLAISVARKLGGEIISADSRQVYKGLDIGTGKVTKKEQRLTKHYLLDVVSPKKVFTADDFKKQGTKALGQILKKKKLPIIVGGTGFYIDVLLNRAVAAPVPPNLRLRSQLERKSNEELYVQLEKLDPQRAKNIDAHNKRRLIRALEIIITTGQPVPKIGISESPYAITWIGINPLRKNLDDNIRARLEKRLKQGMIGEVKKILKSGVSYQRLEDLGLEYRYIAKFLKGEITKEELLNQLYVEIRKYSKRQLTWFKKNKNIKWFKDSAKTLAFIVSKY
jgi:tRNA dimethylallyltransferase